MRTITADFSQKTGKIAALHGVTNGPRSGNFYINQTAYFQEAGIPYSRLHDTEYPFGSGHYVDVHCIFPNEDADPFDPANYDFKPTDAYLKSILDAGAQIIYRLGCSIEHGPVKCHVHPPKDFNAWAEVCAGIIRHYNEGWADGFRWNIRYWEIWNEPEGGKIGRTSMWSGTDEQFYQLYVVTANRLKKEFPDLSIGGYASCGFAALLSENRTDKGQYMIDYANDFFDYITDPAHPAPLDFFSWHLYSGNVDYYAADAAYARKLMDDHGFTEAESILDEWNYSGANMFDKMQTEEGAALYAAAMIAMQENRVDIATNYDGQPFLNYCGIFRHTDFRPTKSFYSLKDWNTLYRLGTAAQTVTEGARLYAASAVGDNGAAVLFSSYAGNTGERPEGCCDPVEVNVKNLPFEKAKVTVIGIDRDNTDAMVAGGTFSGDFTLILPADAFTVRLVKIEPAE